MAEAMCFKCYQMTPLSECVMSVVDGRMETQCRWCKWPKPQATMREMPCTCQESGEARCPAHSPKIGQ
jgi:hypothetical protein